MITFCGLMQMLPKSLVYHLTEVRANEKVNLRRPTSVLYQLFATADFRKSTIFDARLEHSAHQITCADLMKHPGKFLELDFSLDQVIDMFLATDGLVLPVLGHVAEFVGLVSLIDLMLLMERQGHLCLIRPVGSVMREPKTIFQSNTPATKACSAMFEKHLEIAPVVDRGIFKGFLTRHELFWSILVTDLGKNDKYLKMEFGHV